MNLIKQTFLISTILCLLGAISFASPRKPEFPSEIARQHILIEEAIENYLKNTECAKPLTNPFYSAHSVAIISGGRSKKARWHLILDRLEQMGVRKLQVNNSTRMVGITLENASLKDIEAIPGVEGVWLQIMIELSASLSPSNMRSIKKELTKNGLRKSHLLESTFTIVGYAEYQDLDVLLAVPGVHRIVSSRSHR